MIGVDPVDAAAAVLAGVAVALLHLDVADGTRVARFALAREGGDAVRAHAVVARLRHAVVDVLRAQRPHEACGTHGHERRGRERPNLNVNHFYYNILLLSVSFLGSVSQQPCASTWQQKYKVK